MKERIKITHYRSPKGALLVGSFKDKLCICDWVAGRARGVIDRRIGRYFNAEFEQGSSNVIFYAISQLEEYFNRDRSEFSVPLVFTGTAFQSHVWSELMKIPYGTTISYAELATRVNNPKAVRAVASANATNPLSIFVPCHRVIGSNHKLVGYGGGLETKQALLMLEANGLIKENAGAIAKKPLNLPTLHEAKGTWSCK